MENNVVTLDSPALADLYAQDFEQMWAKENFENTGRIKTAAATLEFGGAPATVRVMFSPGCGLEIDTEVARRVHAAQRRVRICSLLINSGTLIGALSDPLRAGRVKVDGIFDRNPNGECFPAMAGRSIESLEGAGGAPPHRPRGFGGENFHALHADGRHDYKILVIDDTVITGSYNFSRSAQFNAENILFIESAALAERYGAYIDHLRQNTAATRARFRLAL